MASQGLETELWTLVKELSDEWKPNKTTVTQEHACPGLFCGFLECADPLGQPAHICLRFCSDRTKCGTGDGDHCEHHPLLRSLGSKIPPRMKSYSVCRRQTDLPQLVTVLSPAKRAGDEQVVCTCEQSSAATGDVKGPS